MSDSWVILRYLFTLRQRHLWNLHYNFRGHYRSRKFGTDALLVPDRSFDIATVMQGRFDCFQIRVLKLI